MQSNIGQSVEKSHRRNRVSGIGKQSIWSGDDFNSIDEGKGILLRFEFKGESIGGDVDKVFSENDFGIRFD